LNEKISLCVEFRMFFDQFAHSLERHAHHVALALEGQSSTSHIGATSSTEAIRLLPQEFITEATEEGVVTFVHALHACDYDDGTPLVRILARVHVVLANFRCFERPVNLGHSFLVGVLLIKPVGSEA
jgi:hypothetical protein